MISYFNSLFRRKSVAPRTTLVPSAHETLVVAPVAAAQAAPAARVLAPDPMIEREDAIMQNLLDEGLVRLSSATQTSSASTNNSTPPPPVPRG